MQIPDHGTMFEHASAVLAATYVGRQVILGDGKKNALTHMFRVLNGDLQLGGRDKTQRGRRRLRSCRSFGDRALNGGSIIANRLEMPVNHHLRRVGGREVELLYVVILALRKDW